jgi:hypothetical protein
MEKILLNGDNFLGELNKKDNVINNAMKYYEELDKHTFGKYLKLKALNELDVLELSCNSDYTITKLTEKDELLLRRLKDVFKEAKEKAMIYTINSVFDKLLDKYGI